MIRCQLYVSCKGHAEFNVIHKAVGKTPARTVPACAKCASRIGIGEIPVSSKKLIDQPGMESRFYKIERI